MTCKFENRRLRIQRPAKYSVFICLKNDDCIDLTGMHDLSNVVAITLETVSYL